MGNGGEGCFKSLDKKVYLRDLVEHGTEANPWIGGDDYTSFRISTSIYGTHLNKILVDNGLSDTFLKKLGDLNKISRLLGDYVVTALLQYDFAFIDAELGLLPDDAPVLRTKDCDRVPVANRLQNTIRISRKYWKMMDPVHKVALLIHEGLYTLVTPSCSSGGKDQVCYQSVLNVREGTGMLFAKASLGNPNAKKIFETGFSIPEISTSCDPVEEVLVDYLDSEEPGRYLPNVNDAVLKKNFIEKVCQEAKDLNTDIKLSLVRKPFEMKRVRYMSKSTNGTLWPQVSLRVEPKSAVLEEKILKDDLCVFRFEKLISNWFGYLFDPPSYGTCRSYYPEL